MKISMQKKKLPIWTRILLAVCVVGAVFGVMFFVKSLPVATLNIVVDTNNIVLEKGEQFDMAEKVNPKVVDQNGNEQNDINLFYTMDAETNGGTSTTETENQILTISYIYGTGTCNKSGKTKVYISAGSMDIQKVEINVTCYNFAKIASFEQNQVEMLTNSTATNKLEKDGENVKVVVEYINEFTSTPTEKNIAEYDYTTGKITSFSSTGKCTILCKIQSGVDQYISRQFTVIVTEKTEQITTKQITAKQNNLTELLIPSEIRETFVLNNLIYDPTKLQFKLNENNQVCFDYGYAVFTPLCTGTIYVSYAPNGTTEYVFEIVVTN